MEIKTAEEILNAVMYQDNMDSFPPFTNEERGTRHKVYIRKDLVDTTIEKYADQEKEAEAVNFHMWCSFGATEADRHLFLNLYREYKKQQTGGK